MLFRSVIGHHGNLLPERLLFYSVALSHKYKLPVRSAVFLLRKEADSPALTGTYERRHATGSAYLRFDYDVVRVWKLPVEPLLTGGLATLPLAPIADVPQAELPSVVARMEERMRPEPPTVRSEFWLSTYYLLGTKYDGAIINELLKGIGVMFESSTYTATIEKGKAIGLREGILQGQREGILQGQREGILQGELTARRKLIIKFGTERFGKPPREIVARLDAITDIERLDAILEHTITAQSWQDALA